MDVDFGGDKYGYFDMCNGLISMLFNRKGVKYLYLVDILNDIKSDNNIDNSIVLGCIIDILVDDRILLKEYNWNFITLDTSNLEVENLFKSLTTNYYKATDIKETNPNYELISSYSNLAKIISKDTITNTKILAKKISTINNKFISLF